MKKLLLIPVLMLSFVFAQAATSKLITSDCGRTDVALDDVLTATTARGGDQYEFLVQRPGFSESYVSPNNTFMLADLQVAMLNNTVYEVQVRVDVNGVWGSYGVICEITTGTVSTKLIAADCGRTNVNIDDILTATVVPTAIEYEFVVSSYATMNTTTWQPEPQSYITTNNFFKLRDLDNPVWANVPHTIQVRFRDSYGWQPLGPACLVTTAKVPGTDCLQFPWVSRSAGANPVDWAQITCSTTDEHDNIIVAGIVLYGTTVGGSSHTVGGFFPDMFVAKYSPAGTLLWVNFDGGGSYDAPMDVAVDGNDDIYVTGTSRPPSTFGGLPLVGLPTMQMFLIKYNSTGGGVWIRNALPSSSSIMSQGNGLEVTDNNNVIATGSFFGGPPGTVTFGGAPLIKNGWEDAFVVSYDINGNWNWDKSYSGNGAAVNCNAYDVTSDENDNIYVTGLYVGTVNFDGNVYSSTNPTEFNAFVSATDVNGNTLWVKDIKSDETVVGHDIVYSKSCRQLFLSGYFYPNSFNIDGIPVTFSNPNPSAGGFVNLFVAALDLNGTASWVTPINGGLTSYPFAAGGAGKIMDIDNHDNIYLAHNTAEDVIIGGLSLSDNSGAYGFYCKFLPDNGEVVYLEPHPAATASLVTNSVNDVFISADIGGNTQFGAINLIMNATIDFTLAKVDHVPEVALSEICMDECIGQTLNITASGTNIGNYSWEPSTYVVGSTSNPSITTVPLDDITYVVEVSDATFPHCIDKNTVKIDMYNAFANTTFDASPTGCSACSGTVEFSDPGGFAFPLNYTLSGATTGTGIINSAPVIIGSLCVGTTNVKFTDANGCTDDFDVVVGASCVTGHIDVCIAGGVPGTGSPVTYTSSNLPSPVPGQTWFIDGDIILQGFTNLVFEDVDIYVKGAVSSGNVVGSKITITNAKVTMDNMTTIQSDCDEMWYGIILEEQADFRFSASRMEDAYKGIVPASNFIGLSVRESDFFNNYYGISWEAFLQNPLATPDIMDNHFWSDGNLKDPYNTMYSNAHILVKSEDVLLGSVLIAGNLFEEAKYGIWKPEDLTSSSGLALNFSSNTFTNCYDAGVRIDRGAGNAGSVTSEENTFNYPNTIPANGQFTGQTYGIFADHDVTSTSDVFNGTCTAAYTKQQWGIFHNMPYMPSPIYNMGDIIVDLGQFSRLTQGISLITTGFSCNPGIFEDVAIIKRNKFVDNATGVWFRDNDPYLSFLNAHQSPCSFTGLTNAQFNVNCNDFEKNFDTPSFWTRAILVPNTLTQLPDIGLCPGAGDAGGNVMTDYSTTNNYRSINNASINIIQYSWYNATSSGPSETFHTAAYSPIGIITQQCNVPIVNSSTCPGTPNGLGRVAGGSTDNSGNGNSTGGFEVYKKYALEKAVPNPTTGNTSIYYSLNAEFNSAKIQVKNVLGTSIVAEVDVTDNLLNRINVDLGDAPQGVYYYSLLVDGQLIDTKKLFLAK